ncbi:uncharacterized protein LOC131737511 isoform X1 [Acipenser ruthenus]|uniref:uncharacterized protein LOC131737511 isoform X1 n=2 Tax=Acipenser ruthenus TaxID=7906 RepID=UPI002741465B|nr:uncharacterized protein LOC131737511 isoform X1 [Acipenser ruthenus]
MMALQDTELMATLYSTVNKNKEIEKVSHAAAFEHVACLNFFDGQSKAPAIPLRIKSTKAGFDELSPSSKQNVFKKKMVTKEEQKYAEQYIEVMSSSSLWDIDTDLDLTDKEDQSKDEVKQRNLNKKENGGRNSNRGRRKGELTANALREEEDELIWIKAKEKIDKFFGSQLVGSAGVRALKSDGDFQRRTCRAMESEILNPPSNTRQNAVFLHKAQVSVRPVTIPLPNGTSQNCFSSSDALPHLNLSYKNICEANGRNFRHSVHQHDRANQQKPLLQPGQDNYLSALLSCNASDVMTK